MTSPHLARETQTDAAPFRAGLRPTALLHAAQHLVRSAGGADLGRI